LSQFHLIGRKLNLVQSLRDPLCLPSGLLHMHAHDRPDREGLQLDRALGGWCVHYNAIIILHCLIDSEVGVTGLVGEFSNQIHLWYMEWWCNIW